MSPDTSLVIVGPTASGKTQLALQCAAEMSAEIVSTDSMQAYIGMDIGTAKPSPSELSAIPHHMVSIWPLAKTADIADFQERARSEIAALSAKKKRVVVVGGSVLYTNAVLDKFDFPRTDPEIRQKYENIIAADGVEVAYRMLQSVDPAAAKNIIPNNSRRIVRALEVNELTGANFPPRIPDPVSVIAACRVGLSVDRVTLDQQISQRVETMFRQGLLGEVETLVTQGLSANRNASRAIGYSQAIRVIDGEITIDQAKIEIKAATSKFARRQQRWLVQDSRITWFSSDDANLKSKVLRHFDEILGT